MSTTSEIFDEATDFGQMGLRDSVLAGVEAMGFTRPTHIQAQLIPRILAGHDVIGQAKTGTGKTAAFGLPILQMADKDVPMQALILTPTRELAAQVAGELAELGRKTPIRAACIIGGESARTQVQSVKEGGHIIVGTPGRVMDLHGRGQIKFDNIRFAVLDEVDRMLDIGFRDDIRRILKAIKRPHQTVFVSATIEEEIERLARSFMSAKVERVTIESKALTVDLVDQRYIPVEAWDKRRMLMHLIEHEKPPVTLVFCRTKATVIRLARRLRDQNVAAREIHGDMPQDKRTRVMKAMREGKVKVLIASDLAARGLDVEHITHVINYDLPEDPDVYVHRIGRTARAGRRGVAWSFVSPEEGNLLTEIEKLTGVLMEKHEPAEFEPGPVPQDVAEQRAREAGRRKDDPMQSVVSRVEPEVNDPDALTPEEIARRFPDGRVPKSPPRRTLGAKFRSRRKR